MARYERGVYEPSDEVRVFDGAEEEDDAEGSRLPLLIVLALVVLCAFAGVVWMAYRQGVAIGRSETPVLAAAGGPEKVAPQNPGGTNVPYQGFKIYEQPAPPDDQADATPPAAPSAQAVKPEAPPVQAAPPKPEPAPKVVAAPPPAPKPAEKTSAVTPPAAKPVPVQAAPPPVTKPAPAATKPPASPPPAMKQAATPPAATATGAPRTLPGVAEAAKPAAAPAPKVAVASGAYVLQIGAYTSQADADAAWKAYKAKHAALLTGYGPDVQKADLGAKGTWYRLRVAGFADKDVASGVCDRLKADGGACFLGK